MEKSNEAELANALMFRLGIRKEELKGGGLGYLGSRNMTIMTRILDKVERLEDILNNDAEKPTDR